MPEPTLRTPVPERLRGGLKAVALAGALALPVVAGGCGDDPFQINWIASKDTVLLYSLARPELNLPAAFDFHNENLVRVEGPNSTGTWDLALDTRDGQLVFLPPGALGITSRARVAALPGMNFDDVIEAPTDTAEYSSSVPVPVNLGTIYVVRTGRSAGVFGSSCVYYAKLEPLVLDPTGGTLRFLFDASPVCNNPRLIPPD